MIGFLIIGVWWIVESIVDTRKRRP